MNNTVPQNIVNAALDAGNINEAIEIFSSNSSQLKSVRREFLSHIKNQLDLCRHYISPKTLIRLKDLFSADDHHLLEDLPNSTPEPVIGQFTFPSAAEPFGYVHEIRIAERKGSTLTTENQNLLDTVLSAVLSVLQEKTGLPLFIYPDEFYFTIHASFGREVENVDGGSMGLALALALYSFLTGQPVPPHLAATSRVSRDGKLGNVEYLDLKLKAIQRERHFITHVLLAVDQTKFSPVAGHDYVGFESLKEAVNYVFPGDVDIGRIQVHVDVESVTNKIKSSYKAKQYGLCMDLAGKLISYLKNHDLDGPSIQSLFLCYWRLGSCYCHKGDLEGTHDNLDKAETLYEKHSDIIGKKDYGSMKNNFAVSLIDAFQYNDAEKILKDNVDFYEKYVEVLPGVDRAKNLSTLSQLLNHLGQFQRSVDFQIEVVRILNNLGEKTYRNINYLAQFYTKMDRFDDARKSIEQIEIELSNLEKQSEKDSNQPYVHNTKAYLLFRETLKKAETFEVNLSSFKEFVEKCINPTDYTHGLINKYYGLFLCLGNKAQQEQGIGLLEKTACFFESFDEPMYRLIGLTVRVEKALTFLDRELIEACRDEMKTFPEVFDCQSYFTDYFKEEKKLVSTYIDPEFSWDGEKVRLTLKQLVEKIPY